MIAHTIGIKTSSRGFRVLQLNSPQVAVPDTKSLYSYIIGRSFPQIK